jgi:hypothetical protein
VHALDETPRFLLLVRERVRPGREAAYNENELRLASACATWNCPHPYLGLVSVANPREIWWLNAFASPEERDGIDQAYAQNQALMTALVPLGRRKEDFREAIESVQASYQSGPRLVIAGARFLVVISSKELLSPATTFQTTNGELLRIAPAPARAAAEQIAKPFESDSIVLAIQPQWSHPAATWVQADPEFWRDPS